MTEKDEGLIKMAKSSSKFDYEFIGTLIPKEESDEAKQQLQKMQIDAERMASLYELEWIDYGWANGWKEIPDRVREARSKGFEEKERKIGRCLHEYVCDELKYRYRADTSG